MSCQFGRVAELFQCPTYSIIPRKPLSRQFTESFFEMIAQLVGDFAALARFQPQKAAEQ